MGEPSWTTEEMLLSTKKNLNVGHGSSFQWWAIGKRGHVSYFQSERGYVGTGRRRQLLNATRAHKKRRLFFLFFRLLSLEMGSNTTRHNPPPATTQPPSLTARHLPQICLPHCSWSSPSAQEMKNIFLNTLHPNSCILPIRHQNFAIFLCHSTLSHTIVFFWYNVVIMAGKRFGI